MFKKIAYVGVFVGVTSAAAMVGCTGTDPAGGNKDFATGGNTDMPGGNNDMNVMKTYKAATPHEIDTNQIGGDFGKGTAVSMSGMIVISPISGFSANMDKDCAFQVFVQDPTCSTGPCGLVIVTKPITNPNGTGAFCGFQGSDATPLKNVKVGDKVDVKGVVDTFASTAMAPATGTVVQHEVEIDELTVTMSGQALPAAVAVTDTASSMFKPYSGSGWAMYEGMRVKLSAPSGKLVTTLNRVTSGGKNCGGFNSNGGFTTAQGANFADTYNFTYVPDAGEVNCWPQDNLMFTSITGIVSALFGGALLPSDDLDFEP